MRFDIWQKRGPFVVCLGNLAQINDEKRMVTLVVLQIIVDDVVGLVIAALKLDFVLLKKSVTEPLIGCADAGVFGGGVHIPQFGAKILYSLQKSVIRHLYR